MFPFTPFIYVPIPRAGRGAPLQLAEIPRLDLGEEVGTK